MGRWLLLTIAGILFMASVPEAHAQVVVVRPHRRYYHRRFYRRPYHRHPYYRHYRRY